MVMDTADAVKKILNKNDGWLQLKEVLDMGINKQSFYNYVKTSYKKSTAKLWLKNTNTSGE